MVRRSALGSILSHALTTIAIIGIMNSCTGAPSPAAKNAPITPKSTTTAAVTSDSSQKTPPPKENRQLVVYYFHGNARCPTCFKLESFTKSEIESAFADAIKTGALVLKTVNIEDKGNEHFGEDYKLYTKSVIVSTVQSGKEASWKNLDQIWQLVHTESQYREYIRKEVKACLEGKCL